LHQHVDYAMLAEVALRCPGWHFVLVGDPSPHVDPRAEADKALCRQRPNIHFLGGRPVTQVPAYVGAMDVNIMCYALDDGEWIRAISPLKLHEYLAAGRPVISADVPSVRPFDHVVRIAHGTDDWEQAIQDALQGRAVGDTPTRRAVAADNSWDDRVAKLESWLAALVSGAAARQSTAPVILQPHSGSAGQK
jgi:glycosyltransferase involved in cell wall biosynthesis